MHSKSADRVAEATSARREKTDQQKQIAAARDLLGPSPVKLHAIPRWFRKSKVFHDRYGSHQHRAWLDHYGTTKLEDGRAAFVSEPYPGSMRPSEFVECAEIAAMLGCDFWISANSWWYPGATIRLIFAERKPS